jgi:hypothetical protein
VLGFALGLQVVAKVVASPGTIPAVTPLVGIGIPVGGKTKFSGDFFEKKISAKISSVGMSADVANGIIPL